ncbi:hypothetical protein RND81_01G064000 [Saponaria officinalis]|uniref:Uncharacterized protein n=1 Tax=Saponaria officinalis TaxID=3572 RepID=A0AAW1NGQ2_SAPOF
MIACQFNDTPIKHSSFYQSSLPQSPIVHHNTSKPFIYICFLKTGNNTVIHQYLHIICIHQRSRRTKNPLEQSINHYNCCSIYVLKKSTAAKKKNNDNQFR